MALAPTRRMSSWWAIGIVLLFCQGCVTGTAHMLPIAGNPMREQAEACERECHKLLVPPPRSSVCKSESYDDPRCQGTPQPSQPASPDRDGYARCLDGCPGARAIDDSSCPDPPLPGVICEKTYRANAGGIIGGAVGVGALLLAVLLLAAVGSFFALFLP